MDDKAFRSKVEELLGDRGKKANRAVRFRDIGNLTASANSAEVKKIAEKVARDIAEGYDNANVDVQELRDEIEAAQQAANQAAIDASNALSSANNANAYTDSAVQQARDDFAVDFAAAQTAVGQAQGYASQASQTVMEARAGVARLFPADMRGGGEYWRSTPEGSPGAFEILPATFTPDIEALVGDFLRIAAGEPNLYLVSQGVSEYLEDRVMRVTVRLRSVGGVSSRLKLAVPVLRSDWTVSRTLGTGLSFATTQADQWQYVQQDFTLPAALANEVNFRVGVMSATGATPDVEIDVAQIRIEDVTSLKEADGFRAQAGIYRDEAVTAKQDAETAAATAQSNMELTAEVAGRDTSVINDTFLVSSDWTRWSGQGTLTTLPNTVYPIGRDWRFSVTSSQSDGLQILSSSDTTWIGQVNAEAYAVEVEFTLHSGSLDGAAIGVNWTTLQGGFHPSRKLLKDIVSGPAYSGKTQLARAIFTRPSGYQASQDHNQTILIVTANTDWNSWTRAAKSISFHRVRIRPATEEELGRGEVLPGVQAFIGQNYFTRAETNNAIATADLTLNASLGGALASVQRSETALATLNGTVARFRNVVTVNGEKRAGIEAVAFDGAGVGTGSVLKLIGDDVVAEGTLSGFKLVIHDPMNLIPDNQMQSAEAWGLPKGPYSRANSGPNFNSIGLIYYDHSKATGSGWQGWVTSRDFSADANTEYHTEFRVNTHGNNCNFWYRFVFIDENGNRITTTPIHAPDIINGNKKFTKTITTPSNCQRAQVEFNIDRDASTGDASFGDCVVRAKQAGSTLITPGGVTSDLITGNTMRALNGQFGSLAAANIRVGNAEIENANIKNAAIDTLKIKDGSVTVQWARNAYSLTISLSYAASVIVFSSARIMGTYSTHTTRYQLRRNGQAVETIDFSVDEYTNPYVVMKALNLGAGTHTFEFDFNRVAGSNTTTNYNTPRLAIFGAYR